MVNDETYWLLADHAGTIRDVAVYDEVFDETDVVNHLQYDAFGNVTDESGPGYTPTFSFTGREYDADADLYYYRARWYDAVNGRFISEDPLGHAAGDVNFYRYCHNDPVNFRDPSGLIESTDAWDGYGGCAGGRGWFTKWWDNNVAKAPRDLLAMTQHPVATARGAGQGVHDGAAMVANAATFHQIDSLNNYVDKVIDENGGLYGVANVSAHIGAWAGEAAVLVWAWGAAGLPTWGTGLVQTSESSVVFQVNGVWMMGAGEGITVIPSGTAWFQLGYWTSITGVPIWNAGAAIAGAGYPPSLWLPNHPCLTQALQSLANGWFCWL